LVAQGKARCRRQRPVIAIGHAHPAAIAPIRALMPKAEARGFVIVPLSTVAKLRLGASG
jgi:polysaccharide deacetylase 2 family uncharacterized protein YibQ